jgi:gamma-glutamylcyclotransferase (GGCT)/AIG2-like uncharacterized protein YtfP
MYYFAYGSNLNVDHMKRRCPQATPTGRLTLNNFKLVFRGVADIQDKKGAKVVGAVYKITDHCLKALDGYEGYPYLYDRQHFTIQIGNKAEPCMTYYMVHDDCIKMPSQLYYDVIAEGYKDHGLDLSLLRRAYKESQMLKHGEPRGGFSWGIPRPRPKLFF